METESEVLVIGGGIAGLSAALCAARLGRRTHVLTGTSLGGHLLSIELIEGYPGFPEGVPGYDLCPIVQGQAADAGAEFSMAEATSMQNRDGKWHVQSPSGDYLADSVILATGTALKALEVPGETKLRGHGVSHCASCDAPLLRNKPVVVAGGGDSAAQEALVLAEHAVSVAMVFDTPELTAQQAFRSRVEKTPRISLFPDSTIEAILGEDAVTGVRLRAKAGERCVDLEADGVFVYIGLSPITSYLQGLLALSETGHIVTDGELQTNSVGIFAAGTVRSGSAGRAAAAAGEGMQAALAADAYLAKK